MSTDLARRAGGALIWRGLAMGGEKIIFLLRLLILARLLIPEDFGLVAIGMVALTMALSLTDFGVVASLIQQGATDKRHLDTAWTINLVRGAGITVALFVSAPWIAAAFGQPLATDIIRAMALVALLHAAASIQIAKLNREFLFRRLAAIQLSSAITNTAVAIVLAPSHGAWALVWGAVAGAMVYFAVSYVVAPYRPALRLSDTATARIASFGRWIFLMGVLGVAADAILRWLIANELGVLELGLFFMASRLAFLPSQLVSELVQEVAFPVYAHLKENAAKAAMAFRSLLVSVAALLMPVGFVFIWLVPDIVEYVLGEQWVGLIGIMQLLILSTLIGMLGDGMVSVLKGTGQPSRIVVMDLLQLVVLVALGWPLMAAYGLIGAGIAWMGSILSSQFLAVVYARRLLDRPFRGVGAPLLAIGTASVLATGTAALVVNTVPGLVGLVFAILASAGVAAAVTLFLDRVFRLGIMQTIAGPFPWLHRFAARIGTAV